MVARRSQIHHVDGYDRSRTTRYFWIMSKRSRPAAQGPAEMKRTKSQDKPSGAKCLVDILPFGAAFHDEPRQKLARKQNWIIGTSALGEKYAEYENKVWADLRARRRFALSPDELTKAVPCLTELDKETHKDLWVQYKRHCIYEQGAKALVNEVVMQRDHLQAQMTNLEVSTVNCPTLTRTVDPSSFPEPLSCIGEHVGSGEDAQRAPEVVPATASGGAQPARQLQGELSDSPRGP